LSNVEANKSKNDESRIEDNTLNFKGSTQINISIPKYFPHPQYLKSEEERV
jgi:hypothetical protein